MFKNKKGSSLSSWTEVALFSTLFILIFISIVANMNVKYSKNIDGTMGLGNLASGTRGSISDYQNTLQQNVNQGQASSSGLGLSLTTTWGIISAGAQIMWGFVTGGWIEQISTGLLGLNSAVADIFRILFVLSIGFIIIKLLLKVKP